MPRWDVQTLRDREAAAVLDAVVEIESESFTNPWTRDMYLSEFTHADVARVAIVREVVDDERSGHTLPRSASASPIVGFCSYWHVVDEIHLNNLAVTPSRRRQGVAAALLTHIIDASRSVQAHRVILEVRRSNTPAHGLYDRFGFAQIAVRPGYYSEPIEDAVVLALDLA